MGIIGTLRATREQQKGEDRRARRPEVRELVAAFWAATDSMWQARAEILVALDRLAYARKEEHRQHYSEQQLRALRRHDDGAESAREHLGLIRMTQPAALASAAQDLFDACFAKWSPDNRSDVEASRDAALGRFEEAARELLLGDD
ncbi:MAG TPA: hypothetical protein VK053_21210 [Jiangellaceae bacterium]|nr:hypothetical protein [Jiangellaceae bacterium]